MNITGAKDQSDDSKEQRGPQQSCLRRGKGNDMKWHVLLWRTDENMYFCQGALIDEKWILSVAHCFVGYGKKDHSLSNLSFSLNLARLSNEASLVLNTN